MSSPDALADGLAFAFLAGPWHRAGLRERAERVLGASPAWLLPLIRHVLAHFSLPPHDAGDSLSRVIQHAPAFRRGAGWGSPRARLVSLVVSPPRMADSRWPVPPLSTTVDLAAWLGISSSELDWFADVRGLNARSTDGALQHYSCHWLRKPRGGYRLLEAPKSRLKAMQRRVLDEVLKRVPTHDAAHGFVPGRSALTCAHQHEGRAILMRLDVEEFFPSIGAARVSRVFRSLGYPEAVARAFTGLCTLCVSHAVLDTIPGPELAETLDPVAIAARRRTRQRLRHRHLPQGAPSSPMLANLACFRLDARLAGAARAAGATYTRYADDLAFSGDSQLSRQAERLQTLVAGIALEEGFRINHHKTRLMTPSQPQRLVGLVTNQQASVPRAERERLEAILTNAVRQGLESQIREKDPRLLESLRGRVAWVEHVNPAHARKLRQLLLSIEAARP